jgi:cobyrinic acid a,c-diamide synthase
VFPFKKGPDYIDAGWLALAAGRACYERETFMVPPPRVFASFCTHALPGHIAVIEGNRGLYDGIDSTGSTSTAELAKLLRTPVILCLDATKTTRTLAAVVLGCEQFDRDVPIKGVVLNRVAGSRHEQVLRRSIETHCAIPVLGAVPKLKSQGFPERHMGLVPTPEHDWALESVASIAATVRRYIDMQAVQQIAAAAVSLKKPVTSDSQPASKGPLEEDTGAKPVVGILRDSAFQFYYPENIEALRWAGAEVVFFSPLQAGSIPPVDALYIGGGFPETHAAALADNTRFKTELKQRVEDGLPVYAECGGLIYLGERLVLNDGAYPMAGVLPIVYGFSKRPQGHGYTVIAVDRDNPFFSLGREYRGHEFHYSKILEWRGGSENLVFRMKRGAGIQHQRDGACYKNVLATYTHLHALGAPDWAEAVVRNARAHRRHRRQNRRSG